MKTEDFQKLKDYVEQQLKVTDENIMAKTIELSNLQVYISKVYSKELKTLKTKGLEKDKIYAELYHHYKFKFDFALESKAEIDTYVKGDDKYYQVALEYAQLEVQMAYLEQVLSNINNLGFRINNYVALKKLKMGLIGD